MPFPKDTTCGINADLHGAIIYVAVFAFYSLTNRQLKTGRGVFLFHFEIRVCSRDEMENVLAQICRTLRLSAPKTERGNALFTLLLRTEYAQFSNLLSDAACDAQVKNAKIIQPQHKLKSFQSHPLLFTRDFRVRSFIITIGGCKFEL